jgi:hypothetical protein
MMLKCIVDMKNNGRKNDSGYSIEKSQIKNILNYMVVGRVFGKDPNPPADILDAYEGLKEAIYEAILGTHDKNGQGRIDETFIKESFGSEYEKYFTKEEKYHYLDQKLVNAMSTK